MDLTDLRCLQLHMGSAAISTEHGGLYLQQAKQLPGAGSGPARYAGIQRPPILRRSRQRCRGVKIAKPKAAKKSATVKWKKISKKNRRLFKNVEIQISADGSFGSGVRTVYVSSKKSSKKIKGLAKGQPYYVRVRAYNGGHVSAWSGVKTVKPK